jgi:surface protein
MQTLLEFMNRDRLKKYKRYNYFPKDTGELIDIIRDLIEDRGLNADLNDIDTSKIWDMSGLFSLNYNLNKFTGDISGWDVSNVKNMSYMFANSKFNGDISGWDVSKVENMREMFYNAKNFDQNLNKWNVKRTSRQNTAMFWGCPLQSHLPKWCKG